MVLSLMGCDICVQRQTTAGQMAVHCVDEERERARFMQRSRARKSNQSLLRQKEIAKLLACSRNKSSSSQTELSYATLQTHNQPPCIHTTPGPTEPNQMCSAIQPVDAVQIRPVMRFSVWDLKYVFRTLSSYRSSRAVTSLINDGVHTRPCS